MLEGVAKTENNRTFQMEQRGMIQISPRCRRKVGIAGERTLQKSWKLIDKI